jgi:arylsulfatase A-like enzyme
VAENHQRCTVGSHLFLCALTSPAALSAEPLKRPNVVFLLADDMRADTIAALGNPVARAPHLDALAGRGFAMTNAYCFGGNSTAVCTPSRNMLLSGNAYFRWKHFAPSGMPKTAKGLLAPGDRPNFPLSMKDAGYLTYHHGKRGNTAPLIQAKFEVNKYLSNDDAERRSGEPGKEIVDEAIAFLKANRDPRPLFLYLAFGNPHDPRVAARKYLEQYDPDRLPLPKNFLPVHPFDNGELVVRDEQLLPWPRTAGDVRRALHEYHATVTALDFHIGRLLQALRDAGQLDHTLVVFSADQGIALGSHGLLGKQSLYEHSMKAPLVLAGPGIPRGKSDAPVYLFDVYPTVCDLVGAKVPGEIDGKSFRPVLDGKVTTARPELLLAYRGKQRAVRDARWKLIRYPEVDVTQLFDLQADPDETRNLADDPAQRDRVADLLQRLARLQKHYGDDLPLTSAQPRPATPVTPGQLRRQAKAAGKK